MLVLGGDAEVVTRNERLAPGGDQVRGRGTHDLDRVEARVKDGLDAGLELSNEVDAHEANVARARVKRLNHVARLRGGGWVGGVGSVRGGVHLCACVCVCASVRVEGG